LHLKILKQAYFFDKHLYFCANNKINIMNRTEEANAERHYILLIVAIVIGLVGIYIRFAGFPHASAVANIILVAGVVVGLKAVFDILK
jgi:hypothetical protein